jgi:hypothetical protein
LAAAKPDPRPAAPPHITYLANPVLDAKARDVRGGGGGGGGGMAAAVLRLRTVPEFVRRYKKDC